MKIYKKSVNEEKTAIEKISADLQKLEKVKMLHPAAGIHNIVYVVQYGTFDWIKDAAHDLEFISTVSGIYRFTVMSSVGNNFNIRDNYFVNREGQTVVNTITERISANSSWSIYILSATTTNIIRETVIYVIEFLSDAPDGS